MRSNRPPVGWGITRKKGVDNTVDNKAKKLYYVEYLAKHPLQNVSYCVLCNMTLSLSLSLAGYDECQGQSDNVHQCELTVLGQAYL